MKKTTLSKEGIEKLGELKITYPQYADVIDKLIELSQEGYAEAVGVALVLFNRILEKGVK